MQGDTHLDSSISDSRDTGEDPVDVVPPPCMTSCGRPGLATDFQKVLLPPVKFPSQTLKPRSGYCHRSS